MMQSLKVILESEDVAYTIEEALGFYIEGMYNSADVVLEVVTKLYQALGMEDKAIPVLQALIDIGVKDFFDAQDRVQLYK